MVRIGLDVNLAAIAGGANLREIVFKLIDRAEYNGCTADLVAAASASYPDNPGFKRFAAWYAAAERGQPVAVDSGATT